MATTNGVGGAHVDWSHNTFTKFSLSLAPSSFTARVAMPALAANFRSDVSRKSPPGQKLTSSVALRSDLRLLKQLASPEEALQSWRSGHKYQLEEVI